MLLSDYLKIGESLEKIGVFDPILDKDNAFFINIQRLKETTTPEFEGSYDRINDFFRKIIKLLDRAEQKSLKDTYFRAAFDIFKFSEVNGICLGFGEKAPGSGFGPKISKMVLETAYDTEGNIQIKCPKCRSIVKVKMHKQEIHTEQIGI